MDKGAIYEQSTVSITGNLTDLDGVPLNSAQECEYELFGPGDYYETALLSLGAVENLDEEEVSPTQARYRTSFLIGQDGDYEWNARAESSAGDVARANGSFYANPIREAS